MGRNSQIIGLIDTSVSVICILGLRRHAYNTVLLLVLLLQYDGFVQVKYLLMSQPSGEQLVTTSCCSLPHTHE